MKSAKDGDLKLTKNARRILVARIRVHADATKHVKSSNAVSELPERELLSIGQKLRVDIGEVIRQAEANPKDYAFEIEKHLFLADEYAFSGEIEFDLEVKLFGTAVQRKAKIVYEHTPDWAYLNHITGKEQLGWESTSFGIEILAIPDGEAWETGKNGKLVKCKNDPCWTKVDLVQDGVLPESVKHTVYDMIDQDARRQDAENRARSQSA